MIEELTELSKLTGFGTDDFNLRSGMRAASGKGIGEVGGLDRTLAGVHPQVRSEFVPEVVVS